jgi:hypothetical protein
LSIVSASGSKRHHDPSIRSRHDLRNRSSTVPRGESGNIVARFGLRIREQPDAAPRRSFPLKKAASPKPGVGLTD